VVPDTPAAAARNLVLPASRHHEESSRVQRRRTSKAPGHCVRSGRDIRALQRHPATYDWYSWDVYLAGTSKGTLVVRVSSGFRGSEPRKEDLAVGLYFHGKELKTYSSLDLVNGRDKVRVSVSHYSWCRRVIGFCWLTSPRSKVLKFGFALETVDKRLLCFDARTGELLDGWEPEKPLVERR
jgi:hypothetical protein